MLITYFLPLLRLEIFGEGGFGARYIQSSLQEEGMFIQLTH